MAPSRVTRIPERWDVSLHGETLQIDPGLIPYRPEPSLESGAEQEEEEEDAVTPEFEPRMALMLSELLDYDAWHGTSWQRYTIHFAEQIQPDACELDLPERSRGSVISVELYGHEVDDMRAACPVGRYEIVPGCALREGQACARAYWRDLRGQHHPREDPLTGGEVTVWIDAGPRPEDAHRCRISMDAEGHPDLKLEHGFYFHGYELAPTSAYDSICVY